MSCWKVLQKGSGPHKNDGTEFYQSYVSKEHLFESELTFLIKNIGGYLEYDGIVNEIEEEEVIDYGPANLSSGFFNF